MLSFVSDRALINPVPPISQESSSNPSLVGDWAAHQVCDH